MLTEVQQIVLTCLLGPEDKTAFRRAQKQAKRRRSHEREKLRPGFREHKSAYDRAHYLSNRDEKIVAARAWTQNNREQRRGTIRVWETKRRRENTEFRITKNLRRRIQYALYGKDKSASTRELLGCAFSELRAHLEAQFRPGMTWENYGSIWHVDHRRPCAKFNLLDPAQQRECFHYTNLQPLFAEENLKKGKK